MKVELTRDEGLRLKPYLDTVGKTTIGVGRNLTDVGITALEAGMLLDGDIAKCAYQLNQHLPWWNGLTDARQRALLNMCFNLGIDGLFGFHNTLALLQAGKYAEAADNCLKSKWAQQVGARATRIADLFRAG